MTSQDLEPRYRGRTIPELEAMWLFARVHGYRDDDFEPFFAGVRFGFDKAREEQQRCLRHLGPQCHDFKEMGE